MIRNVYVVLQKQRNKNFGVALSKVIVSISIVATPICVFLPESIFTNGKFTENVHNLNVYEQHNPNIYKVF